MNMTEIGEWLFRRFLVEAKALRPYKSSLLFLNEAEAAQPKLLFFENVVKWQKLNRGRGRGLNLVCRIYDFFLIISGQIHPYFDQVTQPWWLGGRALVR